MDSKLLAAEILRYVQLAQVEFFEKKNDKETFEILLKGLLSLTKSEYGFIGEVKYKNDDPYLKTYAITNIAWNAETRKFYKENAPDGLEFFNLNTLFGAVLVSGHLIIANDAPNDPRAGGIPEGHPELNAFIGIPLTINEELIGMIGLANREEGYTESFILDFKSYTTMCSIFVYQKKLSVLRKEAIDNLEESESRLNSVIDGMVDALITIDYRGKIISANEATNKLFGYSKAELIDQNVKMLMPEPDHSRHDEYINNFLSTRIPKVIGYGREVIAVKKNGSKFPCDLTVTEARLTNKSCFTGILRDISDRKENEKSLEEAKVQLKKHNKELERLAFKDGLTQLYNRRFFEESLDKVIHRSVRLAAPFSFIIFDVDEFKLYNDSFGHKKGDECLIKIANSVRDMYQRATDVVARVGGEEFSVIMENTDETDALNSAKSLLKLIQTLEIKHAKAAKNNIVTISIGIATLRGNNKIDRTIVDLLFKKADDAMYSAKRDGRNRIKQANTVEI